MVSNSDYSSAVLKGLGPFLNKHLEEVSASLETAEQQAGVVAESSSCPPLEYNATDCLFFFSQLLTLNFF